MDDEVRKQIFEDFKKMITTESMLYAYYRAIKEPGMSVILTILSLGSRVILAYALSALPLFGVTGIWLSIPIGWAIADVYGVWKGVRGR